VIRRKWKRLHTMRRGLRKFARADHNRRFLVVEAMVWLVASRFALFFIPFPQLARRLGTLVPPSDPRVTELTSARASLQASIAGDIGWAVTRTADYLPFKAVCLPQAMAARFMLNRRDVASVMHFGAACNSDKSLRAHAWLDAAGLKITGYPIGDGLIEIACFV